MKAQTAWVFGCLGAAVVVTGAFALMVFAAFFVAEPGGLSLGDQIGLVNVIGEISDSRDVVEELNDHAVDDRVKAVVVRIDTPGGGVAPSQEIYDAIHRLRRRKPVVASMGGMATSGGYYVAVAADSIIANPGSLTGSIGVIFSHLTAEEMMRKIGVDLQVYKSGARKDIGSFHRTPTEEERDLLEGVVSDAFEQFVDAIVESRGIDRETVVEVADGRIFTGRQALDEGLIDALGGQWEAILMAAQMGGIDGDPNVVSKARRRFRLRDMIQDAAGSIVPKMTSRGLEYRLP